MNNVLIISIVLFLVLFLILVIFLNKKPAKRLKDEICKSDDNSVQNAVKKCNKGILEKSCDVICKPGYENPYLDDSGVYKCRESSGPTPTPPPTPGPTPPPEAKNYCTKVQTPCNTDDDCKVCDDPEKMLCQELKGRNSDKQKQIFGSGKYCLPQIPDKTCSEENGGVLAWTGWSSTDRMEWDCLCSYPDYFGNPGCTQLNPGVCEGGNFNFNAKDGKSPSADNCECKDDKIKVTTGRGQVPLCIDKNIKFLNYYSDSTVDYEKKSCEPNSEPIACLTDTDCVNKCSGDKPGEKYTCSTGACKLRNCTPDQYKLKGCNTCQNGKCVECLPGLILDNSGNCVYNPKDSFWSEFTGVACHCPQQGCDNKYFCGTGRGAFPYTYKNPRNGYDYYGCQMPSSSIISMNNTYADTLPPMIYGIPGYTERGSTTFYVPLEFKDDNLKPDVLQSLQLACRAPNINYN
jgi:hypothetical protein